MKWPIGAGFGFSTFPAVFCGSALRPACGVHGSGRLTTGVTLPENGRVGCAVEGTQEVPDPISLDRLSVLSKGARRKGI